MATYRVYRGGQLVLTFAAKPGRIVSTAHASPGMQPPSHPFVDAQAWVSSEEGALGELLRRANSATEFLSSLRQAGYQIQEEEAIG